MPRELRNILLQSCHINGRGYASLTDIYGGKDLLHDCQIEHSCLFLPLYLPRDLIRLSGYEDGYPGYAEFRYKNQILLLNGQQEDQGQLLKLYLEGGLQIQKSFIDLVKGAFGKVDNLYAIKPLKSSKTNRRRRTGLETHLRALYNIITS